MNGGTEAMLLRITILAATLSSFVVGAQSEVALFGTIEDPSGAVVPNAAVIAFNDDRGIRRSTSSDQQGFYAIAALPPGQYKILVRKEGFLTAARVGLSLGLQRNIRCDFVLQVGPVEQVITVEGGPPLLNSEPGAVGTILGRKAIEDLPLRGRSLAGLLELAPGLLTTPANTGEAGQFSASGQRPNANYFTVDGMSLNTGVSGAGIPGQFPGGTLPSMTAIGSMHNLATLDAIEQVQIQTSSFAPAFGRMPGAQVAIITRSGSNELHGAFSDSMNNQHLNANDWIANASGLPRPAMRSNDFSGSLGGPILRNRTFFFLSYEQIDLRQPVVWQTPVPSEDARRRTPPAYSSLLTAFPLPNGPSLAGGLAELGISTVRPAQARVGSLRVDHALTSNLNVFARYSNSPSWSEFGYSQVNRSDFREDTLTVGLTAAISPSMSNDLRVNRTSGNVEADWSSTSAGGAGPLDLSKLLPWSLSFESLSINGVGTLNAGNGGRNSQSQTNVVENFALKHGNHYIRMGADYENLAPRRQGPPSSLSLNFSNLSSLLAGDPGWLTYAQSANVATRLQTASLFIQDTWMLNPRLTLTYGARWEMAPAPLSDEAHPLYLQSPGSPVAGAPIWRDSLVNPAPRIGLAYRITPDSRSVLRAGFGVFYDAGIGAATDEINGAPYNSWQLGAPYGDKPLPSEPVLAYGFANYLRLPRSLEWNLTWQHAWTDRAITSVSYVGAEGVSLLRREGLLRPTPQIAELELATSHGRSNYNGLQAEYRQHLTRGVEGFLSYCWSHSIDEGSWDSPVYLVQVGLTAAQDRASSSFDVRHVFTAALNYDIKLPRGPRFFASGWSLDGIFHARTGFPIDVLAAETFEGISFANVVRPSLVPGISAWITDANAPGGRRLNSGAFLVPINAFQGTMGRNAIRGFGMSQLDMAMRREIPIHEGTALEIRADVSNVFNHPNFADPERYLTNPLFGQPASMLNLMLGSGTPRTGLTPAFQVGGPRVLQVGVRLRF